MLGTDPLLRKKIKSSGGDGPLVRVYYISRPPTRARPGREGNGRPRDGSIAVMSGDREHDHRQLLGDIPTALPSGSGSLPPTMMADLDGS